MLKHANFLFAALSFRQIDAEGRLQKLTDASSGSEMSPAASY